MYIASKMYNWCPTIVCYTSVIHNVMYITEVYRMYNYTFVIHLLYKLDVYWMYNKCILMKFWVLFLCYTLVIHVSLYNKCITSV